MKTQDKIKEIATISAIMANQLTGEMIDKMLYLNSGYISTMEAVAGWAVEFFEKHKKTNWEKVLGDSLKPMSDKMTEIICWDDAIIDFFYFKVSKY